MKPSEKVTFGIVCVLMTLLACGSAFGLAVWRGDIKPPYCMMDPFGEGKP